MQPMGRPKHALKATCFFPIKFWGGRREREREKDYFHFSLVPNVFPLCSFQLLNGFSSGFQYVPQVPSMFLNMSSMAPHFYALANVVLLSHYIRWAKGEELYTSK
jgi:hypothetical protein